MTPHLENYPHKPDHPKMSAAGKGNFDIQVLSDDDNLREELLMDTDHVARIYTLTMKSQQWRKCAEISEVARVIQNGEEIITAFKSRRFQVQKNVLDIYTIKIPRWLQSAFATNDKRAKVRIRELLIKKHDKTHVYGILTEIYSPVYKKAELTASDGKQINIPSLSLLKLGFNKEEIWTFLEQERYAPELSNLYSPIIIEVKEKVNNIMREALPFLSGL